MLDGFGGSGSTLIAPEKTDRSARLIEYDPIYCGTEAYLREEAYRTVTLRESDKVIELPAIQAVFRAMGVSALSGNRFARRTLTEMVTKMEAEDAQARLETFGTYVEYKNSWSEAIERAEKVGIEPPRPVPHPDDIILDPNDGSVTFRGPVTKEKRDRLDEAFSRRDEAHREVNSSPRGTDVPAQKAQSHLPRGMALGAENVRHHQ